jgi:hypothetical protein
VSDESKGSSLAVGREIELQALLLAIGEVFVEGGQFLEVLAARSKRQDV